MARRVNVIGVGMVKFQKPGASDEYNVMAVGAARAALADAKVDYKEVEQAFCGFVKMQKGALGNKYDDRTNPLEWFAGVMNKVQGFTKAPPAAQMFGGAGRE